MNEYEVIIKIKILATSPSDAYDGIGSILNEAVVDGAIKDWSYTPGSNGK